MVQPPARASAVTQALAVVLLAAVFLRAGFAPVAILDSWGDWKYGEWIWQNKRLPKHEPFSPYGDPKPELRDGSWLAEVTYYLVVARSGLEGVALLHALLEATKAGLILLAVRRSTGSLGTAVAVTALVEAACWPYFDAIRTQVPAEVCWAGLLLACSGRVPSRAAVVAAPAVVALWANLSPTFGFAFVLLGGLLLGRFLQETRARRRLTTAARDPAVVRLALMLGLSVAAACLNPYGKAHLSDAFGPDGLEVLAARQWPTLIPVHLWESRVLIVSVLVVLAALRLSPRPFTATEVLLAATFAVWAWFDKRVAPWWLMLAPWLLAPHLQAMFDAARAGIGREGEKETVRPSPSPSLLLSSSPYLLLCVAAVLVLLSPAARWAVGRPLSAEARAPMAPSQLAARVAGCGPGRRVFSLPYWWGDYLLWWLPPGDQVFWYSRPEGFMARGKDPGLDPAPDEWRALVERNRFDTLVVRAESSEGLAAYLAEAPPGEWVVVEDTTSPDGPGGPAGRGLVVIRRTDP